MTLRELLNYLERDTTQIDVGYMKNGKLRSVETDKKTFLSKHKSGLKLEVESFEPTPSDFQIGILTIKLKDQN